MKNLRILLVNDYYSDGGAEKVCRQIETLVKTEGGEVAFFFGTKHHSLPNSPLAYIYSRSYARKFKQKIKNYRPDVIHLHNYYHLLSPSVLQAIKESRQAGYFTGRVILTAHDYHLLCPNSGLFFYRKGKICRHTTLPTLMDIIRKRYDRRGWAYSLLKKMQWILNYSVLKLDKQIDVILAPSKFLKQKYTEKFPDKEIYVVRNPCEISTSGFNTRTSKSTKNQLRLVFLGRIAPEKGIKEFIRSLAATRLTDFQFDIIGDGPDTNPVREVIDELKLNTKIGLCGRIPHKEVIEKLTEYDALVLPSLWVENAPLVLMEAVTAGIRIVTCNYGGMKELGRLCGGSYFMEPTSVDSVEKALVDLKEDTRLNKKPGDRDIHELKEIFSERVFNHKIDRIYTGKDETIEE